MAEQPATIGISAIAAYEPTWHLDNDWFAGILARKFVHHTGIESRPISVDDEVTMGLRAVAALRREIGCDLADCAGVIFASPSFVPLPVAREYFGEERAAQERLGAAAQQLVRRLGIPQCMCVGINWFCSGYSKALALASRRLLPRVKLERDQFFLVVNASRISRITDFGCQNTGPLFGDMATATLLARDDSHKYPVHFRVLYADAQRQAASAPFFNFELREQVLTPELGGGKQHVPERLVFTLDGMGIADAAPRAMSSALAQALEATGQSPDAVRFVVPHQAGTGIVRLTGMKLEQAGIRGELVNGFTRRVGNVSSCSIPFTLKKSWSKLHGLIACPTAAVGDPGKAEVSQGCVLLQATELHERLASAAA